MHGGMTAKADYRQSSVELVTRRLSAGGASLVIHSSALAALAWNLDVFHRLFGIAL
jgi:hypothetical protein